jgi:hypothetical protein
MSQCEVRGTGGSMKKLILILGVSAAILGSGVAAGRVFSSGSSPSPSLETEKVSQPDEHQSDETGLHGGPISRFQVANDCSLVDVSTLPGNWTHGDYVSSVAGLGDSSLLPVAAQSDCGKPTAAAGHGHGPPEFVLQKMETHEHGGPEARGTPGS